MSLADITSAKVENLLFDRVGDFSLSEVIDALPAAIYTTDACGRIDLYNQAAVDIWGREPDRRTEYWCGAYRLYSPEGVPMPHDCCPMARALRSGVPISGEEAIVERPDGSRVWIMAYPTPLKDSRGAVSGAVNMVLDISARKEAEMELATRFRQLESLAELGMLALAGEDIQPLFDAVARKLAEALNVEFVKILELKPGGSKFLLRAGVGWKPGLVGQAEIDVASDSQAGYALSLGQPVIVDDLNTETRFNQPSLLVEHGVVSGLSTLIGGSDRAPYGVLGAHSTSDRTFSEHDVHLLQSVANILAMSVENREYRERQALLVGELSHRMKNNLSVILAISRQTGQHATSVEGFRDRLEERLVALSRAHDLLNSGNWAGAGLNALIEILLNGHAGAERFELDLDNIMLSPSGTQALTLIVHELMTNAAKYGSLSAIDGRVVVVGRHDRDREEKVYRLRWSERGGPTVEEPGRLGFGSRLIEATVVAQCGGTLSTDWRPEGVNVECMLPLSAIAAGN